MAEFFIRRPIVAMVIAIVTVIVGLVTLSRLPIAEYPQVSPTLIEVTANYRGAAAEAVMDSVAIPIESKVNGVDKMLYMQSFSANDGKMVLKVTFDVGTNVDIMQVNTQNRVSLATAQLPDAVKREGVTVNRSSPDLLMVLGPCASGCNSIKWPRSVSHRRTSRPPSASRTRKRRQALSAPSPPRPARKNNTTCAPWVC
jgi:hydrophobic/amphiphilic exporter-1 (mainly G- bacteria), HAE1 family